MKIVIIRFLTACLLMATISCGNNNSTQKKALELKEKELALKEMELQQKADSAAAANTQPGNVQPGSATNANTPETSIEKLLGYWHMPSDEQVNVKFFRDKTFQLNDLDAAGRPEYLEGTFELTGSSLTLLYSDRPKQSFRFYKGAGSNYFIENKAVLFVKGENGGN